MKAQQYTPPEAAQAVGRSDELFPIISALYASVEQPERLLEAMQALGEVLGGDCTQLMLVPVQTGAVAEIESVGGPRGMKVSPQEWSIRWRDIQLPVSMLQTQQAGRVYRSSAAAESFLANPLFRSRFLGGGFEDAIAGVVSCDDTTAALLIQFSGEAGTYDARAADIIEQVLPHIARSCRLRGRLGAYARAASPSNLLQLLPLPGLLTDEAGRCIERNESLDEVMEALGMKIVSGRARFADSYLQDSWLAALAEVRLTAVPCALLASSEDGRQWKVHMTPLEDLRDPGANAGTSPLILVLLEERSSSMSTAASSMLAASTRNLTPAENEVLGGLLRGHTAKLIARARGASVNTVRSQIMTILEKTGHHTQKELIASFGASSFGIDSFQSDGFSVAAPTAGSRWGDRGGASATRR